MAWVIFQFRTNPEGRESSLLIARLPNASTLGDKGAVGLSAGPLPLKEIRILDPKWRQTKQRTQVEMEQRNADTWSAYHKTS